MMANLHVSCMCIEAGLDLDYGSMQMKRIGVGDANDDDDDDDDTTSHGGQHVKERKLDDDERKRKILRMKLRLIPHTLISTI